MVSARRAGVDESRRPCQRWSTCRMCVARSVIAANLELMRGYGGSLDNRHRLSGTRSNRRSCIMSWLKRGHTSLLWNSTLGRLRSVGYLSWASIRWKKCAKQFLVIHWSWPVLTSPGRVSKVRAPSLRGQGNHHILVCARRARVRRNHDRAPLTGRAIVS